MVDRTQKMGRNGFASSIVDLAYDTVGPGGRMPQRKAAFAAAIRSLYARHRAHICSRDGHDLMRLEEGDNCVGKVVLNALDAGITKLEIQAHARLCFTPEGNP